MKNRNMKNTNAEKEMSKETMTLSEVYRNIENSIKVLESLPIKLYDEVNPALQMLEDSRRSLSYNFKIIYDDDPIPF